MTISGVSFIQTAQLTEVVVDEGKIAADKIARERDERDALEEVDEADNLGPRPSDPDRALEEEVRRDPAVLVRVVLGQEGRIARLRAHAARYHLHRERDEEWAEAARERRQRRRVVPGAVGGALMSAM